MGVVYCVVVVAIAMTDDCCFIRQKIEWSLAARPSSARSSWKW